MIPRRLPVAIVLTVLCGLIAQAQQSNPSTTPEVKAPEMKVKAVDVPPGCKQPLDQSGKNEQANDKLCVAGIGDRIIVDCWPL